MRRAWALYVLLVAAEAGVVLGPVGLGNAHIRGGDGAEYARFAANLVDHFRFSDAMGPPFYPSVLRTPGYPVFLALVRLVAGASPLAVRVAQFGLLAGTAVVVHRVALLVGSRAAAFAAGLICATYLPLIWLATAHLTEILSSLVIIVAVWLSLRADVSRPLTYAPVGGAIAVLALVRPAYAFSIVAVALCVLLFERHARSRRGIAGVAVLVGAFALVMAPWTIRNMLVMHAFIPLGSGSGTSLYVSAEQYAGTVSYQVRADEYALLYGPRGTFARITGPVDRRLAPTGSLPLATRRELADDHALRAAAWRTFRKLSPTTIARSIPKRVAYLWGTADLPPEHRSFTAAAHRVAQLQWVLLVAMCIVGLAVTAPRLGTRLWPLLLFPVYVTAVHLVFHAEGRYSVPPRTPLMVPAALGVVWLARRLRHLWVRRILASRQ